MRRCAPALLLLAIPLATGADNQRIHATFYPAGALQGTIEAALELPAPQANNTRLVEDGKRGETASSSKEFRATAYGVTAVLAIDASGSMQGASFESVKAALRDFVSSSRPQDRIAIVTFSDSVELRQPFTADKTQLTSAIEALRVGGTQTLLNAALAKSISLLAGETSNARKHLLVITDGKNEGPGPSSAELTEDARKAGIPVDCLGVTRLTAKYLEPLQALAQASGGAYIRAKGYPQLRQAMGRGINGLLSSPVMVFRLTHIVSDGQQHQLQVVADGAASNSAAVLLPAPPKSDTLLYVSTAAAVVLFGMGMMLIHYSRKNAAAAAAENAVAPPPAPSPAANQPRPARVATVYDRGSPPASAPAKASPAKVIQPVVQPAARPAGPRAPLPAHSGTAPVARPTEFREIFLTPAVGRPVAWLRLASQPGIASPNPPARYPIDADQVWIGTGEANQICVRHDTAVSRAHACIQWSGGDLYLLDNHSTNGTTVNGRAVQSGSRIRLNAGDRIVVGESVFSLEPPESRA